MPPLEPHRADHADHEDSAADRSLRFADAAGPTMRQALVCLSEPPPLKGPEARAAYMRRSSSRGRIRFLSDHSPRQARACHRARARQGQAPAGWPEGGPPLTAAARDGASFPPGRGERMLQVEQKILWGDRRLSLGQGSEVR
jgi:hypothetical protein